jgi:NAD+ synthase
MKNTTTDIIDWLKEYKKESGVGGFVVGVSGGIDSAVVSTLCCLTELPTLVVTMPINQDPTLHNRSILHVDWLIKNYNNTINKNIDLTDVYNKFESSVSSSNLGYANSKARIRMTTLYALAAEKNYIVVGTGNKVEDFGVGFFTKYGDGGVDISPIADLLKSEVYKIAKDLNIHPEIINAQPTDGLWEDGRGDEDQLGATYDELEWAMKTSDTISKQETNKLTNREQEILDIYRFHRKKNMHKMVNIPVFKTK